MLDVNKFYQYFHADWMVDDPENILMLSGRFVVMATDMDVTIVLKETFTDHKAWIARTDPMKSCYFLTGPGGLGVKFFYDKRVDQTQEAIKDCKNMFIDV